MHVWVWCSFIWLPVCARGGPADQINKVRGYTYVGMDKVVSPEGLMCMCVYA